MNLQVFTIRAAARRTGLTTHLIRAWERRYGAVTPQRTPTNRRVYTEAEVERLGALRRAADQGHSIGQIAHLSLDALRALTTPENASSPAHHDARSPAAASEDFLSLAMEAIERYQAAGLESVLHRAAVAWGQMALITRLIAPLAERMGQRWSEGSLRIGQEHLATAVLRAFLAQLSGDRGLPPEAPGLVVATPVGQWHELGAAMVAAVASQLGWCAHYLGASLPAEEIVQAVRANACRAVALSIVYPADDPRLGGELRRLRQQLGEACALLVGGRAALAYRPVLDQIAARPVTSLTALRHALEALGPVEPGISEPARD